MNNNLVYENTQDEIKTELINGKVFTMSPRPRLEHNIVLGNIFGLFWTYLKCPK